AHDSAETCLVLAEPTPRRDRQCRIIRPPTWPLSKRSPPRVIHYARRGDRLLNCEPPRAQPSHPTVAHAVRFALSMMTTIDWVSGATPHYPCPRRSQCPDKPLPHQSRNLSSWHDGQEQKAARIRLLR